MSKHRQAARVDENQQSIVDSLRQLPGVSVAVGHDDIIVGYRGRNFWYEVKSDRAVSKRTGAIRASEKQRSQKELESTWTGHYKVVATLEDIMADMGGMIWQYRKEATGNG